MVMIIGLMPTGSSYSNNPTGLVVHYQRDDGDYTDWNLWIWEDGGEGKAYAFDFEDAFGKVAVINLPQGKRYGFIVRKGNWEQKDIDIDRFVTIDTGIKNIWLYSGVTEIMETAPQGHTPFDIPVQAKVASEEETHMRIHYKRYSEDYSDWNLWIWPEGKDGKAYPFSGMTDFGALADIIVPGTIDVDAIGFIVRKGEWEAKDVESDRYVHMSKKNKDGILEVYLLEGTETVYFQEEEIDLSPKFLKAEWLDDETLRIQLSVPLETSELKAGLMIKDEAGNIYTPKAIKGLTGETSQRFAMSFQDKISVSKQYSVYYDVLEPMRIDISGLYDTESFQEQYSYGGALGALYEAQQTTFKVWAPTAQGMQLNLYKTGHGNDLMHTYDMQVNEKGVWQWEEKGDLHGTYYTFSVIRDGKVTETYDPYAVSAGVNGNRSMVVDFARLQPEGWHESKGPSYSKANDILVYEAHIRDVSMHPSSGIEQKGKYLGMVERGTKTPNGTPTGIDHFMELGVTHVQILPMYDYNSIDETRLEDNVFNWGYDPKNYNVPEGSYASDPYDGNVRVMEMKEMIKGFHDNGIGVIMDVVYNHTALSADSNLNILMPGYYYRMTDGQFSNASGCGNETASERDMVRKFMIDSLKHWVLEYHIDGFRFDLMGIHDIETMQAIERELRAIKPDIILYGEGWTGGSSPLSESLRLVKKNILSVESIGAFNDDFRDAIKGHVFDSKKAGFANGALGFEESVKFGIVGATEHPQIVYRRVNYSVAPWANSPSQSINYVSAHDNLTLWDKLLETNPDITDLQRKDMLKLSYALVLTSQGTPFLHFGDEFLRSKGGDHNSYKSPDAVNQVDWTLKETHQDAYTYVQGLIALRKAYPQFRMETAKEIQEALTFFDESTPDVELPEGVIGYTIADEKPLLAFFNGNLDAVSIKLPKGQYQVLVNHEKAMPEAFMQISGGKVTLPASSALILIQESQEENKGKWFVLLALAGVILTAIALRKKKK